jgi:DNA-binding MarR family transcriptional regulator
VNSTADGFPQTDIEIDRLIHEPARMIIMAILYVVDEADFVYLAQQTGLTPGNINSHMSRLLAGGYVTVEKTFVANRPRTAYRMTEEGRVAIRRYRQQVGKVLAQIDAS